MELNKNTSFVSRSQCYVIKQMVNAIACTFELWMHLGGLLSTQEARVALGYRLVRLLRLTQNRKAEYLPLSEELFK